MARTELAIFDWNGTLLDDLTVVYESVVEIFRTYVIPAPTLEQYRNEIQSDFMKFYFDHGFPKETRRDDLNAIRKRYLQEHGHRARLRPNVKELLELCRKLRIHTAIVSGEKEDVLLERLDQFQLLPLLNEVRGNSWEKERVLEEVVNRFRIPAQRAFYLDDSVDGLQAAKNLGIVTIGFTSGYYPKERILSVKPNFPNRQFPEVDSLEEVMRIVYTLD